MTRPADLRALVERATPGPETYLTTRALHEHEFARHQLRAALADLAPALLALWEAAERFKAARDAGDVDVYPPSVTCGQTIIEYHASRAALFDAVAALRRAMNA